jgi:hypothetical protein
MIRGTKNGIGIAGSQVYTDIQSTSSTQLITRTFMESFVPGDTFVSQFAGTDTSVRLVAGFFTPPTSVTPTSAELLITKVD